MLNYKTNAEILEEFDKIVVGHTKAKKMLISLVNRSKIGHYHKYLSQENPTDDIESINCLLVGASGTGKTFMVRTLHKLVSFPLVTLDATRLGPVGGSEGITVKDIAKLIVENARECMVADPLQYFSLEGTIDQTVVFIDEIDKRAKPFESSGTWNLQIQASLLSLLEGEEGLGKVSFIFAGAFSDLRAERGVKKSIGFHSAAVEDKKDDDITDRDVIKYGLMPELVGRLSSIVTLDEMTYEMMDKILHEMLIPERLAQLQLMGVDASSAVNAEVEDTMIEEALESGQGVRSLKRGLTTLFNEVEFNYEQMQDLPLLDHDI